MATGGGIAVADGAVSNGRGGRFVGTSQLTEMQKVFVRASVLNGMCPTDAARVAGYQDPHARSYELVRKPHVQEAMRQLRAAKLSGELANTALDVMRGLMEDEHATPAAVRFQAAKWCLEHAGHGGDAGALGFDPDKSLSEYTLTELEAFISKGNQALADLRNPPPREINPTGPKTIDGECTQDSAPFEDDSIL